MSVPVASQAIPLSFNIAVLERYLRQHIDGFQGPVEV